MSKAVASVACLVRVSGRVARRYEGNEAVDIGRYIPVVRRGDVGDCSQVRALARRVVVDEAPVGEAQ